MAHFVALLWRGVGVVAALSQAAEAVRLGAETKGMGHMSIYSWLKAYITTEGRIEPSRRGSNTKTESFLSDENMKRRALEWLQSNVRAAQPKGSTEPPLNVNRCAV
eukprot:893171-Prymnesium_polylepis.1